METHESGYKYNLALGDRNFLIQRNWDPILQKCSMVAEDIIPDDTNPENIFPDNIFPEF